MKQFLSLLLLLCCFLLLSGCYSQSDVDSAWEQGYDDGQLEGYVEGTDDGYDRGFESGYDFGYSEGYWAGYEERYSDIRDVFIEAEYYASENSEWSAEDAMAIVDAYTNNEPLFDDMVPSKEEYQEAVEILWLFYEYFYGARYEP